MRTARDLSQAWRAAIAPASRPPSIRWAFGDEKFHSVHVNGLPSSLVRPIVRRPPPTSGMALRPTCHPCEGKPQLSPRKRGWSQ
ncbi:MAG: hypothetical protein N2109_05200 [Fimbriimonadales bacterium]|nr:hypothetical protein [Fimbriimonadales bacterium]